MRIAPLRPTGNRKSGLALFRIQQGCLLLRATADGAIERPAPVTAVRWISLTNSASISAGGPLNPYPFAPFLPKLDSRRPSPHFTIGDRPGRQRLDSCRAASFP